MASRFAVEMRLAVAGDRRLTPADWHGWFYRQLGAVGGIYHAGGLPPFSLQTLNSSGTAIRLVLLAGELAGHLSVRVGAEGPQALPLRECHFQLIPYERLMTAEKAPELIRLRFIRPVAFRQGAKILPVPLPGLFFRSAQQLWDQFVGSGLMAPVPVTAVEQGVELADLDLCTAVMVLGVGDPLRGGVGTVMYRVLEPALRLPLWTLARFAALSGVGWRRAFGAGAVCLLGFGSEHLGCAHVAGDARRRLGKPPVRHVRWQDAEHLGNTSVDETSLLGKRCRTPSERLAGEGSGCKG